MNLNSNLNTLDPAFAKDQNATWMTSQIFNGLVELDTLLNPVPSIAQSWKVLNDGLIYRFILRNDVIFHESKFFLKKIRKVNAWDVKYSFTRICNPQLASPGFWIFNGKIKGIEDYLSNKSDQIEGFKAINDTIFEIHLNKPFAPFIYLLAMPYAFIVPKEVVEKSQNFSLNPIGTGPFVFKNWEQGKYLIRCHLCKNAYLQINSVCRIQKRKLRFY
jgi:peptide/nickel transport system substrate-binding protein